MALLELQLKQLALKAIWNIVTCLLNKLLLCMQVGKYVFLNMNYIPVGLASNIRVTSYTQLICDNNAYLTVIASIPVISIRNTSTLNLIIPVKTATGADKPCTIQEIIMETEWCLQIEPMQTPGHILLLTTKSNIDVDANGLMIIYH